MKRITRALFGANMVEYVIPAAVISIVVGLGLYNLYQNKDISTTIVSGTGGKQDTGGKISMGDNAPPGGIYETEDGKARIYNNNGNSVVIPKDFYEKYKTKLDKYIKKGYFDLPDSDITETSGTMGIEELVQAKDATRLYSMLLSMAAKETPEGAEKTMLQNMAKYGRRLGNLENDLIAIKTEFDSLGGESKSKEQTYYQAKDKYKTLVNDYINMPPEAKTAAVKAQLTKAYTSMKNKYTDYREAVDKYKNSSAKFAGSANESFDDIKNNTGESFDAILEKIEASTNVDEETKSMVLPIGVKIKAIKDSVSVVEEQVKALLATFDEENVSVTEAEELFNSLNIDIDEKAGDETIEATYEVEETTNSPANMPAQEPST